MILKAIRLIITFVIPESRQLAPPSRGPNLLWLVAFWLFLLAPLSQAQCVTDLHLTSWNGNTLYQVTNSITADTNFTLSGNANITFKAGSVIKLENGFRATAGTSPTFHALIQACTITTPASKDYIRLGNRVIAIENH
jgi:hypothetical protein